MSRAERRHQAKVKQTKRKKYNINKHKTNPRHLGQLKDGHTGCSCSMCKPHAHGFEPKYKPSEMRKLQDDGQSNV